MTQRSSGWTVQTRRSYRVPIVIAVVAVIVVAYVLGRTGRADAPSAPVAAAACLAVPTALIDAINTGIEGSAHISRAAAVRSDDFETLYFVAGELDGSEAIDGPGDIGVWVTNSLTAGGGLIFALDGYAHQFSDWGLATQAKRSDHGYDESRGCL